MTNDIKSPVAWVIPGDDNAKDNGSIDAMAWQEGEFTRPLYDACTCEMQRAIQAWLDCPAAKRPSPAALGQRISEIAAAASRS